MNIRYLKCLFLCFFYFHVSAQTSVSTIAADGWSGNSVNTVIFRKNALVTHQGVQYAAYYDAEQYLVLAKRSRAAAEWTVQRSQYRTEIRDAHKSISIMVDGSGILHVSWGHHNSPLNYAKSVSAGSLKLGERLSMCGSKEDQLTYPEFYKLADGSIVFLYRDGSSGNGSLIMNSYSLKTKKWSRLQDNLIDGEGKRNAYWQMTTDEKGTMHLSWVWRENPDVSSNHDLCYAQSRDGGRSWQKSTLEKYNLPINASTAEYACRIPENAELINQTSMSATKGNIFIASYWREKGEAVPQYHLVANTGTGWKVSNTGFRKTPFSLSGHGTKKIPVSRPQLLSWVNGKQVAAAMIFRDQERGNRVSVAVNSDVAGSADQQWSVSDIHDEDMGDWEPVYDTELWSKEGKLNLFLQQVTQVDGEGMAGIRKSPVQVLEWNPLTAGQQPSAYLFSYFTGNGKAEEAIHFAISKDGYTYKALNGNLPVISSAEISSTGGVRDPHLLRGADGKTFYMVVTDMQVAKYGWGPNYSMVMLKSSDLVHWTSSRVDVTKAFPAFAKANRVWAPQTIYDVKKKKYMLYWSMRFGNGPDIIYYAYANKDFTALETEPKQLYFSPGNAACIDGDIIFKDGLYHLFFKTEGAGNGIKKAVSKNLTSGYVQEDRYLQQTTDPVEGAGVFKLNNSDEYILMYDVYTKGRYQFTRSRDLKDFKAVDEEVSMDFHPRHGTVLPITSEEAERLLKAYPSKAEQKAGNPALKGYYADPEILYSNKTGRYHLYPTTDGFTGWSGTFFKSFSSDDLLNWKDDGVLLDLKDLSWAKRNAWAPTMAERKLGNTYQYFYYYCAEQKIGVAVADHPSGPFKDSGKPLISRQHRPKSVQGGQEIDPDVFKDPQSGKYYLYWGNGYLAAAALNDDMVSIDTTSIKLMTPDVTFREGIEVFFRAGKYYFLWSENDTRSEDYRVRYAWSDSPTGKLNIPEDNLILAKDPEQGIYGTGHNCVIQLSGTDQWRIIYHRFHVPDGIGMGEAAGYHREVCIDELHFNADGTIRKVIPTLTGLKAVNRPEAASVLLAVNKANVYWQSNHPPQVRAFWDEAAYHTGNMEILALTGNPSYRKYSEDWAAHNQWKGAKSDNRSKWKYQYGETDEHVLFGDWQICFQTYIDLYKLKPEAYKVKRAKEVMEYQMHTAANDYWWWADGLYMVMPVMTKLYQLTGDQLYLEKLHAYFSYANSIMYDDETGLYYRDAKYVYPKHQSANGKKDFWARGDGWVFAGLAKVLKDLPEDDAHRKEYLDKYLKMAKTISAVQQPEGYWTRSLLDPQHAPGPETSGTAFFTYGLIWGINNGILEESTYLPVVLKAWNYLEKTALQQDGKLGYVQPIGERAIPGQTVDAASTANFGLGAFLLAGCELYRFLEKTKS